MDATSRTDKERARDRGRRVGQPTGAMRSLLQGGNGTRADPSLGGLPYGEGGILGDVPLHEDQRNPGFDAAGYDRQGYNAHGYNRSAYDRRGFDFQGYDRNGKDFYGRDRLLRLVPPPRPNPAGWASAIPPGGTRDPHDEAIRQQNHKGAYGNDGRCPLPPYPGIQAYPGEQRLAEMPRHRDGYGGEPSPRAGSVGVRTDSDRRDQDHQEEIESDNGPSTAASNSAAPQDPEFDRFQELTHQMRESAKPTVLTLRTWTV